MRAGILLISLVVISSQAARAGEGEKIAPGAVEKVRDETPETRYRKKRAPVPRGKTVARPPKYLRHHRDATRAQVVETLKKNSDKGNE